MVKKIRNLLWAQVKVLGTPGGKMVCPDFQKKPKNSQNGQLHQKYQILGMARGIPRPSILEVPDLFSLLDSLRNKFYHSSAPRILAKICWGPRKYWISFKYGNFRKFSEICRNFSVFKDQFGIITQLWNIKSMLNFFLNFFQNSFEFFGGFSGFFSDFLDNSFLEIPRGPRGIDFVFLDPRGM